MDVIKKATNDKRLIDANALDERFDKRIEWLRLDVHDKYSLGLYHGAATDKDLIGEMPTVDAVSVVRCRECKHLNVVNRKELYANCPKTNTVFLPFELDTREHFCSLGEREEGTE